MDFIICIFITCVVIFGIIMEIKIDENIRECERLQCKINETLTECFKIISEMENNNGN